MDSSIPQFQELESGLYVALVRLFESEEKRTLVVQIDGRSGRFRVEWGVDQVVIDDGKGFKTLEEAQKFVELYLSACKVQQTTKPRIPKGWQRKFA
jgi:hypothetical protein